MRIFFCGHFAIDSVIRFQKEYAPTIGGSVSYCSLALSKYSSEVDISIISNIGKLNFDTSLLDIFKERNISLETIKWSETNNTHFILNYFNHDRILTLKTRSPDLTFNDIPNDLITNAPDAIVLVPLCNEITPDYVSSIVNAFPNTYIGIDLQGFIRKIDESGTVSLVREENIISNMNNIIDIIGDRLILKGSEEEMKILSGELELFNVMEFFNDRRFQGISIMTLGENGSMITKHGKELIIIPAFKPESVADETGAGDVYLSIFIYEFLESDKSWEAITNAGYLASSAASFLVEKNGTEGVETKEKVLNRVKTKNYINKEEN